jgi:hypothetical protein
MTYDEITEECEQLSYRDKLRLAQLLLQLGRKEEEIKNPQKRGSSQKTKNNSQSEVEAENEVGSIEYVAKRLLKLKPAKLKSLTNSVSSMFQFQGGISETDEKKIILELQKKKYLKVDSNNRVTYLK